MRMWHNGVFHEQDVTCALTDILPLKIAALCRSEIVSSCCSWVIVDGGLILVEPCVCDE